MISTFCVSHHPRAELYASFTNRSLGGKAARTSDRWFVQWYLQILLNASPTLMFFSRATLSWPVIQRLTPSNFLHHTNVRAEIPPEIMSEVVVNSGQAISLLGHTILVAVICWLGLWAFLPLLTQVLHHPRSFYDVSSVFLRSLYEISSFFMIYFMFFDMYSKQNFVSTLITSRSGFSEMGTKFIYRLHVFVQLYHIELSRLRFYYKRIRSTRSEFCG